jgi:hypothetical protein
VLVDGGGRPVDYRFLETNPAFVAQTGLAGAVGRTARELVPGIEDEWVETYGRVALTGEPTRLEQGSDAMGRWFDAFAFRVGRPEARHVAVLFSDVTAPRAAERERERLRQGLEVERARLANVFQHAPAFLAVLRGPDYVFTLVNEAYYRLVGDRELVGKPVWEALPEVRGQGFEERLDRVVATGEPYVGREVPVTVARTPARRPRSGSSISPTCRSSSRTARARASSRTAPTSPSRWPPAARSSACSARANARAPTRSGRGARPPASSPRRATASSASTARGVRRS